jgi:hypothetical protein
MGISQRALSYYLANTASSDAFAFRKQFPRRNEMPVFSRFRHRRPGIRLAIIDVDEIRFEVCGACVRCAAGRGAGRSAEQTAAAPQPAVTRVADPDSRRRPLQPDFTLAALPTTLRMPKHKSPSASRTVSRARSARRLRRSAQRFLRLRLGRADRLELRYG